MTRNLREIVRIDEDLCNGCGDCIIDCPEGALQMVSGKARLVKESYCDGLGVCIGKCPVGAITIEEREADAFDEEAVEAHMAQAAATPPPMGGCPGAALRQMAREPAPDSPDVAGEAPSQLSHWPVQLALVPPAAPFLKDANLLLVDDCVPFAFADFHQRFLRGGHPVLVACPKLDEASAHVEKLAAIFRHAGLKELTIVHMEVPCCSGLCGMVQAALKSAGRDIPVTEVTVNVDGKVIDENPW